MRDIKFRVWEKPCVLPDGRQIAGELRTVDLYFFEESGIRATTDYLAESYVIMQYIGLRDTTGRDIYEGDIVEFDRFGYASPETTTRYVIEWSDAHAKWDLYRFSMDSQHRVYPMRVIGNIYETPELRPD